jgi:hypothetical protein
MPEKTEPMSSAGLRHGRSPALKRIRTQQLVNLRLIGKWAKRAAWQSLQTLGDPRIFSRHHLCELHSFIESGSDVDAEAHIFDR